MRCSPGSGSRSTNPQVLEHGIVNLVVWSGLRDRRYRTYEETETDNAELFRQRAAAFMTEAGKNQMIEELDMATAFFVEVDDRIKPLVMEIIEALGVSKHMPRALEDAMQEGFGDPLPGL